MSHRTRMARRSSGIWSRTPPTRPASSRRSESAAGERLVSATSGTSPGTHRRTHARRRCWARTRRVTANIHDGSCSGRSTVWIRRNTTRNTSWVAWSGSIRGPLSRRHHCGRWEATFAYGIDGGSPRWTAPRGGWGKEVDSERVSARVGVIHMSARPQSITVKTTFLWTRRVRTTCIRSARGAQSAAHVQDQSPRCDRPLGAVAACQDGGAEIPLEAKPQPKSTTRLIEGNRMPVCAHRPDGNPYPGDGLIVQAVLTDGAAQHHRRDGKPWSGTQTGGQPAIGGREAAIRPCRVCAWRPDAGCPRSKQEPVGGVRDCGEGQSQADVLIDR